MIRKLHAEPVFRISNFLWITLVLLLVSLIWRGLSAFLAFIEEQNILGHHTDADSYIAFIANHLLTDWSSETFSFLGQIIGLAFLFKVGPLQGRGTEKETAEKRDRGSATAIFGANETKAP